MKAVLLVLVAVLAPISAAALEIPAPGTFDDRMKFVDYNPDEVFGITGHYGFATHIQFAPNERIRKIALGDPQAWEIGPVDNHLFLKPKADQAETNMTVLTNRRVYSFELGAHASLRGAHPEPNDMFFQVKFRYPEDEARRAQYLAKGQVLEDRLRQGAGAEARNWNYWVKGDETLAPNKAYDDRRFTYLTFANNKEMPAIYVENQDGSESLVNTHVEGDVIVVHKIARKLVLRKGLQVACVFNREFDPNGVSNVTGTTVPGVQRVIKGGE